MFESFITDLKSHPKFAETRFHIHHHIPKHDHLLRSARYSYRLAPMFGADRRVCTRAAMLHDLDSRLGTLSTHGAIAAHTAAKMGEPEAVCTAIRTHMFPLGPAPTSREGWVLVLADKLAALSDFSHFLLGIFTGRSLVQRRVLRELDPFFSSPTPARARRLLPAPASSHPRALPARSSSRPSAYPSSTHRFPSFHPVETDTGRL